MNNFLILYDTKEEDLARDFRDFLHQLNIVNIELIPLGANEGQTLQKKENKYFDSSCGALFIVTPRYTHEGKKHCSDSVSVEIGIADTKYSKNPERIIHLLEKGCEQPVVIQRAYIPFVRDDIRSIIRALTIMIKDLKRAGFINSAPRFEEPNIKAISDDFKDQAKQAILHISKQNGMCIDRSDFFSYLRREFNFDQQKINFLTMDLENSGIIKMGIYHPIWFLTPKGKKVAQYLFDNYKAEPKKSLNEKIAEAQIKRREK